MENLGSSVDKYSGMFGFALNIINGFVDAISNLPTFTKITIGLVVISVIYFMWEMNAGVKQNPRTIQT